MELNRIPMKGPVVAEDKPCKGLKIRVSWARTAGEGWRRRDVSLPIDKYSDSETALDWTSLFNEDHRVVILNTKANEARKCSICRHFITKNFKFPPLWWRDETRRAKNGYFGCREERTSTGGLAAFNSWVRFQSKFVNDKVSGEYNWRKFNVFSRWTSQPEPRVVILLFDGDPQTTRFLEERISDDMEMDSFHDPFWFYPAILATYAWEQDTAIWGGIRNVIRESEKLSTEALERRKRFQPNFHELHDNARHTIHISEVLEVAVRCSSLIVARHERIMNGEDTVGNTQGHYAAIRVHDSLQYYDSAINSLGSMAKSNEKRLGNQIHLSFNTVAQDDSKTSLQIGRAVQVDSLAMKTIAFVTLFFLPGTFISAIFSMSFFDYDADSGTFAVSGKMWMFWAVAIPFTMVCFAFWYVWQRGLTRASAVDNPNEMNSQMPRMQPLSDVMVGLRDILANEPKYP